jgi:hypothetical protein
VVQNRLLRNIFEPMRVEYKIGKKFKDDDLMVIRRTQTCETTEIRADMGN